jgi:hypothetical protein
MHAWHLWGATPLCYTLNACCTSRSHGNADHAPRKEGLPEEKGGRGEETQNAEHKNAKRKIAKRKKRKTAKPEAKTQVPFPSTVQAPRNTTVWNFCVHGDEELVPGCDTTTVVATFGCSSGVAEAAMAMDIVRVDALSLPVGIICASGARLRRAAGSPRLRGSLSSASWVVQGDRRGYILAQGCKRCRWDVEAPKGGHQTTGVR